jgi:hypothetical protein
MPVNRLSPLLLTANVLVHIPGVRTARKLLAASVKRNEEIALNRNRPIWAIVLVLIAGCAGTAQSDWQTRVGRYSLDDVTRELGRPESCIGLDDGGTACSWLTARDRDSMDKLILTFSANGILATSNHVRF